MRLRNMFVNILQIDTRVIPNFLAVCSSLNRLTITPCDHAVGRVSSSHTQFTSFRSSLTSADPPALMSSHFTSASPALYVGRSATARSISW
jgi:hypothetical protein